MRRFSDGDLIVERHVWDGLLWAARPALVVSDVDDMLVYWRPAGTIGCSSTSRGIASRDHLPADERQLVSLESRAWLYRAVPARGSSLTFARDGSWASIAVTWRSEGTFLHWYVNFQQPMKRTPDGYDTLDLVVDLVVAPDWSAAWKDRRAFDTAIERGIFDTSVADAIEAEATSIEELITQRAGPFDAKWTSWRPPTGWDVPTLPDNFRRDLAIPPGASLNLA